MPDISEAHRRSYSNLVISTFQQKQSRLEGRVKVDTSPTGKVFYYDNLGQTKGQKYHDRHGKVQPVEMAHDKVALYPSYWEWSAYLDEIDKLQMLFDPASSYVQEAKNAHSRLLDEEILKAVYGPMNLGENAPRSEALSLTGNTSVLVAVGDRTYETGTSTGNAPLTISKLLKARELLADNEADGYDATDEASSMLTICCTQEDINRMLMHEKTVNSDYVQMVNSFVEGRIKVVLGFAFVRVNKEFLQVPATGQRRLPVFHKESVCLAKWKDLQTSMNTIPERRDSVLLRVSCSLSASRIRNQGVAMIDVNDPT